MMAEPLGVTSRCLLTSVPLARPELMVESLPESNKGNLTCFPRPDEALASA